MVDLTATLNFEPSDYLDDGAFDRFYRPGLLDALGAVTEETAVHNPTNSLIRLVSDDDNPNKLAPEDAQEKYGIGNLRFDVPVSEARAKDLHDMKLAEMRRQLVLSSVPTGVGGEVAKFGAGLLASLADPLNILSAFIPGAAIRGGAAMRGVAAPSFLTGKGGTVGSRVFGGAAEGAIGAAMIEPLPYWAAQKDQLDYSLADSMLNIAFGTVIGGGLHGVAKVLEGRREKRLSDLSSTIDKMDAQTKDAMLRSAIADSLDDKALKNHASAIRREVLKDIPFHLSEFHAAKTLSEAPQALRFDAGTIDGSLYRSYTKIPEQDLRWMEGAVVDLETAFGGQRVFIEADGQGSTQDVIGYKTGSPAWFQEYNKNNKSTMTKAKARAVLEKIKSRKPLGKEEIRVAETLWAVGRDLREQNARQIVDFRDHRQASKREIIEQEIDGLYRRELEADTAYDNDYGVADDFFADLESLAEIDLAAPKKLRRSEELKLEADEAVEKLRQESEALGGNKEFDAIMESADLEVKAAEAEADGWKFLGACMARKG